MTIQDAERLLELYGSYDEKKIKAQYRRLSKKWHPDACAKNGISESLANEKIRDINNAYDVLSKYLEINKKSNQTYSNQTYSNINQLKQKLIKDLTNLNSFEYQKILKLRETSEIKNLNIDEKILEINNRYEKLIITTIYSLNSRSIVSQSQIIA